MSIIGHQRIINLLDKAIAKNAVSHAYLFSGPEHVGKFTVALEFAKKLTGSNEKINSDLIIVSPEVEPVRNAAHGAAGVENKGILKKKDIKIEAIKGLLHQLSLSSQNGGHKVAIIDDADRMNKSAQNALLKALEEPYEKVVLILVAQDNRKLLPTIISRCQKVRFSLIAKKEIKKNIDAMEEDENKIIFWSLGRPGLLTGLIANKAELDFREKTLDELKHIFSQNTGEKFFLAENLSKDTREAAEKLNLWLVVLRENALGNKLIAINQEKSLAVINKISESLELIKETNSNARLILENLFLEM